MTTEVTDFHNPSFVLFPVNNDRTAWRPISLPVILVEPDRRDALGNPVELSQVSNVRIIIEDVPQKAAVAGHDHVGLFFPDRELFAVNVSTVELYDRLLEPDGQRFFQPDGTEIAFSEAVQGDLMQYATRSGIRDTITYVPSANYYDLSDFFIDVEELPPDYYFMTFNADYFVRISSGIVRDELLCIDAARQATAVLRFRWNHPGNVMEEQVRLTPQPYFTSEDKAQDSTIEFYRPFTDAMQDIFDESVLLEQVNWVDSITPDFVPYLAALLGLDIPFFPRSFDNLRKVMLRNIVRLQQLKGSRRALIDLFNLFGFSIFIINLYWSKKACRLVRPGESLPPQFEDQEIDIVEVCQIEPMLSAYNTDGFGDLTVPLLYRPTTIEIVDGIASRTEGGDIIVDGYLVEEGSVAHTQLQAIVDAMDADPNGYGESVNCSLPAVTGTGIVGFSQIILDSLTGEVQSEAQMGIQPPFSNIGTNYETVNNIITLTFNGAILFTPPNILRPSGPDLLLYAFATYDRQEFIVPEDLENLQSNRFDVQILTRIGTQVQPDVLDFLINFLFDIKAFHSLLNVLIYRVELTETYEVTDWCVGGDIKQRFDTDGGKLQVPPAIIPRIPEEDACSVAPEDLGYKPEDILLREFKLENLEEEHQAWKALDARAGQEPPIDVTRLEQVTDNTSREICKFNPRGQDKILVNDKMELKEYEYHPGPNANTPSIASEINLDESPVDEIVDGRFDPINKASRNAEYSGYGSYSVEHTDDPDPLCEEDGATDFCYKGRVQEELLYLQSLTPAESYRCVGCEFGMGSGVYYEYPVPSILISANSPGDVFSGKTPRAGAIGYLLSSQNSYLAASYDNPISFQNNSTLGRLLRGYDTPTVTSLHFTNRLGFKEENKFQKHFLAIQRPEIDIELTNMHFPGCRFPTMNRLEDDFTHPTYTARPWDDEFSTYCGPDTLACSIQPTFLNAVLVENTNGDETLVFDEVPLVYRGNGLVPDISSLSTQAVPTSLDWDSANDIVHSAYSSVLDINPAVELEVICPCSVTNEDVDAEGQLQADDLIRVNTPLFQSAGECPEGDFLDFCDGYACVRGFQDRGDTSIDRDGLYADLFDGLGIPRNTEPTDADSLFLLISGIRVTTGVRLDCGCQVLNCDGEVTGITSTTEPTATPEEELLPCNADLFIDQFGDRDWNCDQIETETIMVLQEPYGAHCDLLDGTIPTLFELVAGCCQGSGSAEVVE